MTETKIERKVFAVPDGENIIDEIHPVTGLSICYGKDLAKVREEYPTAEIMSLDDWIAAKAARQDSPVMWAETTAERFDEMLNVLPPLDWRGGGFLVGEPWDHHAMTGRPRYQGFMERHGKFLVSNRPMTRKEFAAALESWVCV